MPPPLPVENRYSHLPENVQVLAAQVPSHPPHVHYQSSARIRQQSSIPPNHHPSEFVQGRAPQMPDNGDEPYMDPYSEDPVNNDPPVPGEVQDPDGGLEYVDEPIYIPPDCPPAFRPVHNENSPEFQAIELGRMNIECSKCHALHWQCEQLTKSSCAHPEFDTCCLEGKVKLPKFRTPPHELNALFNGTNPDSKHFLDHIHSYNAAFSLASLGIKVDTEINNTPGPHIFKINGELHHQLGQLLPGDDRNIKYAQIYFYDTNEQLEI